MRLGEIVAYRYLVAARGISFLPDFRKALADFEGGDPGPMREFARRVEEFLLPGGGNTFVDWYHGLGTAKRNALKGLVRAFREFQGSGSAVGLHDYWIRELRALAKPLRTLELASAASVTEDKRVVEQDGFRIRPMPGVTMVQASGALEALHQAALKLRPVFPQVLYGDVFLSTHLGKNAAAWYVPSEDKFYLNVRAKKRFDDIYTIVHELGHRFDDRFFKDRELKQEFWDLSTRKEYEKEVFDEGRRRRVAEALLEAVKARKADRPIPHLSDEVVLWITTRYTPGAHIKDINSDYLAGKIGDREFLRLVMGDEDINIHTDKLLRGPLAVTPYGGTKPKENFAEAFAHFVLKMPMPAELQVLFEKLSR